MLEIISENQSIATMILITTSSTLGFLVVGLVAQAMNYIRNSKVLTRIEATEARLISRLKMIETKTESDMLSLGVPATLEDLIKRDLEDTFQEYPDNLVPLTEEEFTRMMEDIHGKLKS